MTALPATLVADLRKDTTSKAKRPQPTIGDLFGEEPTAQQAKVSQQHDVPVPVPTVAVMPTATPVASMCSGFGKYHTDKDGKPLASIDLNGIRALVDKPQQVDDKAQAQWLIPSTLHTRTFKEQERRGAYWMLWADLDSVPFGIETVSARLDAIVGGADYEIYNSRSATEQNQKCRILLPLGKPLSGADWVQAQTILNDKLEAAQITPDRKSQGNGQVLYLPNRGDYYDTITQRTGQFIDPMALWGANIAAKKEAIKQAAIDQQKAGEAAKAKREALQAKDTNGDIIGEFNRAYSVGDILLQAGYDQHGDTYRHPNSETGNYSASVKDGRVHTLSSADPLYSDGNGAHSAFSAFTVLFAGGDTSRAAKLAGDEFLTIGGVSWNKTKQREYTMNQQPVVPSSTRGTTFTPLDTPYSNDAANDGTKPQDLHPLARFIPMQNRPKSARWVIPGVVEHGVVTIAGARGVGKTTAVLPLALVAAGLHEPDYRMAPKPDRWRHVIYVSEHVEQVQRIVAGVVDCAGWGVTWKDINERLHVVEARRMPVENVVAVADIYKSLSRVVDGVEILPLIVFDTQAACFAMDNENDNSEASQIMAALKQQFHGAPIWIIGHVAKASIGRSEIAELTARGAGAFEADAIQNLYLVKDNNDARYLCIGKTRVEPKHGNELAIVADYRTVAGVDEWGDLEDVYLRWASVQPMDTSRKEQREQQQQDAEKARQIELRQSILDAVETAWITGNPINRSGVRTSVSGNTTAISTTTEKLVLEGWLQEITVPSKERTNSKKDAFLVRLSTPEQEEWKSTGTVPEAKKIIPVTWRKEAIPFVPESEGETAQSEGNS